MSRFQFHPTECGTFQRVRIRLQPCLILFALSRNSATLLYDAVHDLCCLWMLFLLWLGTFELAPFEFQFTFLKGTFATYDPKVSVSSGICWSYSISFKCWDAAWKYCVYFPSQYGCPFATNPPITTAFDDGTFVPLFFCYIYIGGWW